METASGRCQCQLCEALEHALLWHWCFYNLLESQLLFAKLRVFQDNLPRCRGDWVMLTEHVVTGRSSLTSYSSLLPLCSALSSHIPSELASLHQNLYSIPFSAWACIFIPSFFQNYPLILYKLAPENLLLRTLTYSSVTIKNVYI